MILRGFSKFSQMKYSLFIFLFLVVSASSLAQVEMSKADRLYFEYAYVEAIQEYKKEILTKPLSNQQFLNLAASYFKTGDYQSAADSYFDVYKKNEDISSDHFNMMLQAMARTSGTDRVSALLGTRVSAFPRELMENAELNYDLISTSDTTALRFTTFNINSNSPQSDFGPTFYRDKLLFTSGRPDDSKNIYGPSGESYLHVYVGRVSADGDILNPNRYTGVPETKFHQATPYFSEDLNQLFFSMSNSKEGELIFDQNGKNALAIGTIDKRGNFIYLMRDLGTSFYYPFYDQSTDRLYFAAKLEDSYGGTDLYYVSTNNGLIMSSPTNLGPRINSPGNEIAPYIYNNSLYFASDVFYGLGGMDLYKSELLADENYSIPINLGSGINSNEDDFGLIIKSGGEGELIGYFASNRPGGKGGDDIYGFRVDEMPGPKTLTLKGNVVSSVSKQGIEKVMLKLLDKEQKNIKEVYTDEDGNFRVEIPWHDEITLEVSKSRHSTHSLPLNKDQLIALQQTEIRIDMANIDDLVEEREEQTVIRLNKFYFSTGSARITEEMTLELDKVVTIIEQFPQLQLRIESHTDSRGGSATNFRVSQNRADAIKKYLQDKGVPTSNILYSVGYGEDRIINQCTNGVYCLDFLHRQNERHLIVVLNYKLLE